MLSWWCEVGNVQDQAEERCKNNHELGGTDANAMRATEETGSNALAHVYAPRRAAHSNDGTARHKAESEHCRAWVCRTLPWRGVWHTRRSGMRWEGWQAAGQPSLSTQRQHAEGPQAQDQMTAAGNGSAIL